MARLVQHGAARDGPRHHHALRILKAEIEDSNPSCTTTLSPALPCPEGPALFPGMVRRSLPIAAGSIPNHHATAVRPVTVFDDKASRSSWARCVLASRYTTTDTCRWTKSTILVCQNPHDTFAWRLPWDALHTRYPATDRRRSTRKSPMQHMEKENGRESAERPSAGL